MATDLYIHWILFNFTILYVTCLSFRSPYSPYKIPKPLVFIFIVSKERLSIQLSTYFTHKLARLVSKSFPYARGYSNKQDNSLSCTTETPFNLKTVLLEKIIVNSILMMLYTFQADPYLIVSLGDTKYDRKDERIPKTLNPKFGR